MNDFPINYKVAETTIDNLLKFFKKSTIRGYCKNCPNFQKVWSCPPYDFSEEEYIHNYKFAYIIGAKLNYSDIREYVDKLICNSMDNIHISTDIYYKLREIVDKNMFSMENLYNDSKILLGGKCTLCNECAREKNSPCLHKDKLRYSLESLGFEVSSITENILKDKIIFTGDSLPPYCLSIYALFSKEQLSTKELEMQLTSSVH